MRISSVCPRRAACGLATFLLAALTAGCGNRGNAGAGFEQIDTAVVTLPDGYKVTAESVYRDVDLMRGLMFRDSLAQDRGMLFLHNTLNNWSYWMYQTRIPLDIIWMDDRKQVVEVSADTPPCTSKKASECPSYGGHAKARYVLELSAGAAAKHGVRLGATLDF